MRDNSTPSWVKAAGVVGFLSAIIGIFVFITGKQSLHDIFAINPTATPNIIEIATQTRAAEIAYTQVVVDEATREQQHTNATLTATLWTPTSTIPPTNTLTPTETYTPIPALTATMVAIHTSLGTFTLEEPIVEAPSEFFITTNEEINIYSDPEVSSEIVGLLQPDELAVAIGSTTDGWVAIQWDDITAWVPFSLRVTIEADGTIVTSSNFSLSSGDIGTLPILTITRSP